MDGRLIRWQRVFDEVQDVSGANDNARCAAGTRARKAEIAARSGQDLFFGQAMRYCAAVTIATLAAQSAFWCIASGLGAGLLASPKRQG